MGDVIALRDVAALTPAEQDRLTELEAMVTDGVAAFVRAGRALREIHDARLYREVAPTWEQYIDSKWGMSKRHADRLIAGAGVAEAVGPMGPVLPQNERQARALTALDSPDEQREAWAEAVETAPRDDAGRRRLTAAHVERVVAARRPVRTHATPAVESPTGECEAEPDVVAELDAADKRIRELEALNASLATADHHREIIRLHARLAQVDAVAIQARAEASEARRQAQSAMSLVRRVMKALGVSEPRAIVPAIEALR